MPGGEEVPSAFDTRSEASGGRVMRAVDPNDDRTTASDLDVDPILTTTHLAEFHGDAGRLGHSLSRRKKQE